MRGIPSTLRSGTFDQDDNAHCRAPLQTVPVTLDSMNSDLAVYYRKQTHPSSDFLSTGTGFNANDSTTWKKEGNLSSPVVIVGSDMVTLGGDSTFQSFSEFDSICV